MVRIYPMICVVYEELEKEYCHKYGEYPDIDLVFDYPPMREHYNVISGWCADEDTERGETIRRIYELLGICPANDILAWLDY